MHNEQPVIASTDNDRLTLEQDFNQIQDNHTVLRRSSRSRQLPSYLQEFHCNIDTYLDYSNLSCSHRQYALTISTMKNMPPRSRQSNSRSGLMPCKQNNMP